MVDTEGFYKKIKEACKNVPIFTATEVRKKFGTILESVIPKEPKEGTDPDDIFIFDSLYMLTDPDAWRLDEIISLLKGMKEFQEQMKNEGNT